MIEPPKPKAELVVARPTYAINCLDVTALSEDAHVFVRQEASKYGQLIPPVTLKSNPYRLVIGAAYKIDAVEAYLKSYND